MKRLAIGILAAIILVSGFLAHTHEFEEIGAPTCPKTPGEESLERRTQVALWAEKESDTPIATIALSEGFGTRPLSLNKWTCVPVGFYAVLIDDKDIGDIEISMDQKIVFDALREDLVLRTVP